MEFFVELAFYLAAGMVPTFFIWIALYFLSRKIKPEVDYSTIVNIGTGILLTAGCLTIVVMPPVFLLFIVMAVSMIVWSVAWYYLIEKRRGAEAGEAVEGEDDAGDGCEDENEHEEKTDWDFGAADYLLLSRSLMTAAFLMVLGLNYYCLVSNTSGHADFSITDVVYLFLVVGVLELLLVAMTRARKIVVTNRTSVFTLALCLFGMIDLMLLVRLEIAPVLYLDWIKLHH